MRLHILGICGTFMGGLALIARQLGHEVSGSDANVYPPMSTQLAQAGIGLHEGYSAANLDPAPDLVLVGNALSRGNPAVEQMLEAGLPYVSGPQWLAEQALAGRWTLAVAGTHGKTTTSSLLAWILERAGLAPGFLIGGLPANFGLSARLGTGRHFVVEADEYDTAFFDKRSKFLHYRPRTLVLNNLEYDHADIFPDIAAIETQFQHLLRTVPASGLVVTPHGDARLEGVLARGCWSRRASFGADPAADWSVQPDSADFSRFTLREPQGTAHAVHWQLCGEHNALNAAAAVAAAAHAGVDPATACAALAGFAGVKRRLELLGEVAGVRVYDDFAHHPTAIAKTIGALRARVGAARILAVFEPRSNSMRLGTWRDSLGPSLAGADRVLLLDPGGLGWDLSRATACLGGQREVLGDLDGLLRAILAQARPGDHVLIMSNGAFGGLHGRVLEALAEARR